MNDNTTTTRYCSRKQYGWLWAHEPNICYSMGTTTTTTHHRISDARPTCNRRGKIDLKFWVREWMLKTFAFSSVLAFFGYLHITTNYYTTQHSFLLNKFEFILPLLLNTIYIIYAVYIDLLMIFSFQLNREEIECSQKFESCIASFLLSSSLDEKNEMKQWKYWKIYNRKCIQVKKQHLKCKQIRKILDFLKE